MLSPLAVLAASLDRLGHHEPAAVIGHFADTPFTRAGYPEITTTITHLREALGDDAYEALAAQGASMTNAAMAAYAFEQIDRRPRRAYCNDYPVRSGDVPVHRHRRLDPTVGGRR